MHFKTMTIKFESRQNDLECAKEYSFLKLISKEFVWLQLGLCISYKESDIDPKAVFLTVCLRGMGDGNLYSDYIVEEKNLKFIKREKLYG